LDTELLLEAERLGHRIVDVPVEWREDADSRVRVVATAWGDLKGLLRITLASARWAGLICLKLEIFLNTKNTKVTKKLILCSFEPSAWVPYRNSCSVLTP
jgi:hypothetical protein